MFFPDEVRDARDLPDLPKAGAATSAARGRELSLALQIIDSLSGKWDPAKYQDTFRERVMKLVAEKAKGGEIAVAPELRVCEGRRDRRSAERAQGEPGEAQRCAARRRAPRGDPLRPAGQAPGRVVARHARAPPFVEVVEVATGEQKGEARNMATKRRKSSKPRYGAAAKKRVGSALRRAKRGTLKAGKGRHPKAKSRKQAIAIGLSEARSKGAKVPPRPRH